MLMINLVFKVWAYLPFFALTDDTAFLAGKWKPNDKHQYYFSVINILFGEMKIQLFSFSIGQPEKHFILFRVMRLSNMKYFMLSDAKANQLEKNYKEHYARLSKDDQIIEKESLIQHLCDEKARIETSYNKINAFTTIIIAIIPIAIAFVDVDTIKALGIGGWTVFSFLIYANINLCAWIFQAINVRGFMVSSFSDLKESEDKSKEYNWQIYYDWQQMKRKADMYVSFVRYMKKWIVAVIILTAMFSVVIPLTEYNEVNGATHNVKTNVYTFEVDFIEKAYDESASCWNLMLADLHSNKYEDVLVLYNGANNKKIVEVIKCDLKQFENQKIVWIEDNTLKENVIKVIMGEEK